MNERAASRAGGGSRPQTSLAGAAGPRCQGGLSMQINTAATSNTHHTMAWTSRSLMRAKVSRIRHVAGPAPTEGRRLHHLLHSSLSLQSAPPFHSPSQPLLSPSASSLPPCRILIVLPACPHRRFGTRSGLGATERVAYLLLWTLFHPSVSVKAR